MDGKRPELTFLAASDYQKRQDGTDMSWADIFLDEIHSDDAVTAASESSLGVSTLDIVQQKHYHSPSGAVRSQLQANLPTDLQRSLPNGTVQQAGRSLCGRTAYLTPSASGHQHGTSTSEIQNMMALSGHHMLAAPGQHLHVNSTSEIQNMMAVSGHHTLAAPGQHLHVNSTSGVQNVMAVSGHHTLAAPGQHLHVNSTSGVQNVMAVSGHHTLAAPGQHLHVNSTSGVQNVMAVSGHHTLAAPLTNSVPLQALLQPSQMLTGQSLYGSHSTGLFPSQHSVHIENPKVVNVNFGTHVIGPDGREQQAIIQSLRLTHPVVGTQLISAAAGSVIPSSLTPAATSSLQNVLSSGQASATYSGIARNLLLRPLEQNVSPAVFQSGHKDHLVQPQHTLIASSGPELQVVNTDVTYGRQVPSVSPATIAQQQGMIMNVNNSGVITDATDQIMKLVSGQNIFGQMLKVGQFGGSSTPHMQVRHSFQGAMAVADDGATHLPATASQLVIHHGNQLQGTSSPSILPVANSFSSQRLCSGLPGSKTAQTLTPNTSSASSTPVLTPTPSTPVLTPTPSTPTPASTPELLSDFSGSTKSDQSINILKQALDISDIDLQSFDCDISFLDESTDCFPSVIRRPPSLTPGSAIRAHVEPAKTDSKTLKSELKTDQSKMCVNNSSVSLEKATACHESLQEHKVQGQVRIFSRDDHQCVVEPSSKSAVSTALNVSSINRTNSSIPGTHSLQMKAPAPQSVSQNSVTATMDRQIKADPFLAPVSTEQEAIFTSSHADNRFFTEMSCDQSGVRLETQVPAGSGGSHVLMPTERCCNTPGTAVQDSLPSNPTQGLHVRKQKISTLSGTFVKQELVSSETEQEVLIDSQQCMSQRLPFKAVSMLDLGSSVVSPSLIVSSASHVTVATTTQSHQTTIMSTAQVVESRQRAVSTASSCLPPHSSSVFDTSFNSVNTFGQTLDCLSTLQRSGISTEAPPSSAITSKEKDVANVKALIPIRIADSTLMLSLTPGEKERLENQVSCMSRKDQEGFLVHQQNVLRRTQQVRQRQLEQQQTKHRQQLQHPAHSCQQQQVHQLQQFHQQQVHQFQQPQQQQEHQLQQQQQIQQAQHYQQPQQHQVQQQLQQHQVHHYQQPQHHVQQHQQRSEQAPDSQTYAAAYNTQTTSRCHLPSTVQELLGHPHNEDAKTNIQPFSSVRLHHQQEQHFNQTSNKQVHSDLQQTSYSSAGGGDFVIPLAGPCLAEQQLLRDRTLALDPDIKTPFRSLSDAIRRLVRYHTVQDHKPEQGSKILRIWDARYSKLCDYLVRKKRSYMQTFSKVKLYHDMIKKGKLLEASKSKHCRCYVQCQEKQPEYIQNLICFNRQLLEIFECEKEAENCADFGGPEIPFGGMCSTPKDGNRVHHNDMNSRAANPGSFHLRDSRDVPSFSLKRTSGKSRRDKFKLDGRRTNGSFVLKVSVVDVCDLPTYLRPVVDVERSDSEYEFDSHTSNISCNQSVVVRRRTVSVPSCHSDASHSEVAHHSSEEEGMEETADESSDEEEENIDEIRETNYEQVSDGESVRDQRLSQRREFVSVVEEMEVSNEDSISADTDVFLEAVIKTSGNKMHCNQIHSGHGSGQPRGICSDENSTNMETSTLEINHPFLYSMVQL